MSGRKSNLKQYPTISSGVMTGTSVITSAVTAIEFMDNIGYQFDWTGSPVGTFQVQISANYNQDELGNVITPGTWVPVMITYYNGTQFVTSQTVPTSVGSPVYLDLSLISAPWVRAVYTNASGSGILIATVCGKMV